MFGGRKEEPKQQRRSYFGMFSSRQEEPKEDSVDKFKVDANIEDNQLLLWANDVELEEVNKFLVQLGEIPPEDGNPATVRMTDAMDVKEAETLLRRLQQRWHRKNQLRIDAPRQEDSEERKPAAEKSSEPKTTWHLDRRGPRVGDCPDFRGATNDACRANVAGACPDGCVHGPQNGTVPHERVARD